LRTAVFRELPQPCGRGGVGLVRGSEILVVPDDLPRLPLRFSLLLGDGEMLDTGERGSVAGRFESMQDVVVVIVE
jgi:hypothetical protein